MTTGKCNQVGCGNLGAFRFTWPGEDEAEICVIHAPGILAVAKAIGMHLQLIPIVTVAGPEGVKHGE